MFTVAALYKFTPFEDLAALQGPLADDLMARVFGDAVRAIKFFRFGWFDFQGVSMAVARSGYSTRIPQ